MQSIGGFTRRAGKTPQSRRALKKMDSKVVENPKTILFLRGANTSTVVNDAMNDLSAITKPFCKKLKKRNAFHAFEGRNHLEFLGHKNDCSLVCFGSDSKKRPNNLVLGRMFDFHLLEMIELGVVAMDRIEMGDSKGRSIGSIGAKAFFVFEGTEFTTEPVFIRLRNFLLDFFRGSNETEINIEGVDRVVFVSLRSSSGEDAVIAPSDDCVGTKPQSEKGNTVVCLRHYAVQKGATDTSKTRNANNVKLVDIGPNFDFELRRVFMCPAAEFKQACKIPREAMAHLKSTAENVSADNMGNLRGQLHMGKQDVTQLNLRRFKAHKRGSRSAENDGEGERDGGEESQPARKRRRRSGGGAVGEESTAPETDI